MSTSSIVSVLIIYDSEGIIDLLIAVFCLLVGVEGTHEEGTQSWLQGSVVSVPFRSYLADRKGI